jgi:glycosyltransferase involved in cell wall biosynthesis
MKPLITVLLPAFNAEQYIEEAVQSILDQTYPHFELLVFDDGSTDRTLNILKNFKDDRLKVYPSKKNQGYVYHLNQGIKLAKGKYIARMDADDYSYPKRFALQINYLEKNPQVGLAGTWIKTTGRSHRIVRYPRHSSSIKILLNFYCTFAHPTVMMRKSVLTKNHLFYKASFTPSEDFELWSRMQEVTMMANIPKVLLRYRMHEGQIGIRKNQKLLEAMQRIQKTQIQKLIPQVTKKELTLHWALSQGLKIKNINFLDILKWVQRLKIANKKNHAYAPFWFSLNLYSIFIKYMIKRLKK